jgi:hypothetical protein
LSHFASPEATTLIAATLGDSSSATITPDTLCSSEDFALAWTPSDDPSP